ncbi:MAG TPA: oligopeptide transporter, OPT family [Rhizomicrobium sp.]|jgi:putative OPT family oligopeptide transporter|nr:oligopeptide transporter, OPT family [Rhizomicrobium sp.]
MPPSPTRAAAELTVRGVILGVLITLVFTAANVYLGLKVGLTFASSIPAAVISMAVLSLFRGSTILENNIVQTVASAAGTLSSIIFVLPGLVIVGWWTGFPFWTSFLICISGGTLGVLFTIPLRRALVTHSDLPYPEGLAAAEVLKVGAGVRDDGTPADPAEAREGLLAVVYGAVAALALVVITATQVMAGEITRFFHLGKGETSYDVSFSLALVGAGHLVGLGVGLAGLLGVLIGWGVAVPWLTAAMPDPSATMDAHVMDIWRHQVRFIGAGAIAVASIWTLLKLTKPVIGGLIDTVRSARSRAGGDESDRDLSGTWIGILTAACFAVIAWVIVDFARGAGLGAQVWPLTLASVPFVLVAGFLIAAICGYMAGLIGSSNSPISGVGILTIVSCASLLLLVAAPTPETTRPLIAFALIVTAIVFAVATISNDNLQDLKTGQLVGASPRLQQIALIIGVLAGAAVIPWVLNLLVKAYGFVGMPHPVSAVPLNAPQATLISALAQGVLGHNLNWTMIGIGAVLGVGLVVLDEVLGWLKWTRLPPLGVGIGIYLPMSSVLPVTFGAIIGHWYNSRAKRAANPQRAERLGTLVASGMIVGESLFGVLLAALIWGSGKDAPLALVPADFAWANPIAVVLFFVVVAALYGWMVVRSASTKEST